jgi:flagellar basal-body rod protein FlgC
VTPIAGIAQSGLAAATQKVDASASNLANANDTSAVGSSSGYQPVQVQNVTVLGGGVVARAVTVKPASLIAYDPSSSVATAQGYVNEPNIDPVAEVTNQLAAGHAFVFSLKALEIANENEKTLLDIKS